MEQCGRLSAVDAKAENLKTQGLGEPNEDRANADSSN